MRHIGIFMLAAIAALGISFSTTMIAETAPEVATTPDDSVFVMAPTATDESYVNIDTFGLMTAAGKFAAGDQVLTNTPLPTVIDVGKKADNDMLFSKSFLTTAGPAAHFGGAA